jgi:hypothetical protein
MRVCRRCGLLKPISSFNRSRNECKSCQAEYHKDYIERNRVRRAEVAKRWYDEGGGKAKTRAARLQKTYGLTVEEFESMVARQEGRCAICKGVKPLVIDHCHKSDQVRALLCSKCNTALGLFCDDIELLQEAISYLEANLTLV